MRSTVSPGRMFLATTFGQIAQHGKNRSNENRHAATDAVYAAAEFLKNAGLATFREAPVPKPASRTNPQGEFSTSSKIQ